MEAYSKLLARSREVALIQRIDAVLGWDQQTNMPTAAAEYRAEQNAWLAGTSHRLFTAQEVGDWLSACEDYHWSPGSVEVHNVRQWRHDYRRATQLPAELVETFSRETAIAHEVWVTARKESNYKHFRPNLQKIVELVRQMADCYGYEAHPCDALLEGYEPGLTTAEVSALFETLAPQVTSLIRSAPSTPGGLPPGPYPIEAQVRFNRLVAGTVGFDFSRGKIDTAAHPFCTDLGPSDVRLTTRYDQNDFTSSLYGVLHEVGHGLYEQGLDPLHHGTPAGTSVSLGIHESQSRLWENHVGRSLAFWRVWHEKAVEHFPQLAGTDPETLVRHVNRVAPSFIRVEADEVTYDLHIVLRYRMELALISGELNVADLPEAWNAEFKKLFGLEVPDAAHGCLQDVHWCGGGFGYFPTYTLGNLNAAQLFSHACASEADIPSSLESGNYAPLLEWLRSRIHRHGSRLKPAELMSEATGKPTDPGAFLDHLRVKIGH